MALSFDTGLILLLLITLFCCVQGLELNVVHKEPHDLSERLPRLKQVLQLNNRVRATGFLHHLKPQQPFHLVRPSEIAYDRSCNVPPSIEHLSQFFALYPGFGVSQVEEELQYQNSHLDSQLGEGFCTFRFQQTYFDIPVSGGEVLVHTNPSGGIRSANGVFVPISSDLSPQPVLTPDEAIIRAQRHWNEQRLVFSSLLQTSLVIWQEGLSGEISATHQLHLAFKVEATDAHGTVHTSIVDAIDGHIIIDFDSRHKAGLSKIWQYRFNPNSSAFWRSGAPYPTSSSEANQLIYATTSVKATMSHVFNRNSYDNYNADMLGVFEALAGDTLQCPNAHWNGARIEVCPGLAVLDIVAHEWGHAYVTGSANLRYLGQSGALNEGYADVTGETIQLGYHIITEAGKSIQRRTSFSCEYENNIRWLLGEASSLGAMRDMYNPNCKLNPRFVGDFFMECTSADNSGVHTNSGIPNQAYSLLVDGGTVNNITVQGIGLEAAFAIWGRALYTYSTSTTTFFEHARNLEASCQDLVGLPIRSINPAASDLETLSSSACDSVSASILATKLRDPFCGSPVIDDSPPRVLMYWPKYGDASLTEDLEDQLSTSLYGLVTNVRSDSILCIYRIVDFDEANFTSTGQYMRLESAFLIMCPAPSTTSVGLQIQVAFSDDLGDSFTTLIPIFTYYQPSVPLSVTPITVDASGGFLTISGTYFTAYEGCSPLATPDFNGNLPDCLTCLFGSIETEYPVAAEFVSDTTIRCHFPNVLRLSTRQDSYPISISKNNQFFWYTMPPTVVHVTGTPAPLNDHPAPGPPLPDQPSPPPPQKPESFSFSIPVLILIGFVLIVATTAIAVASVFLYKRFFSRSMNQVEIVGGPDDELLVEEREIAESPTA